MTAAGTVQLRISREEALHASLWVLVYGPFDRSDVNWGNALSIGERLFRASKRKRSSGKLSISLPRAEAKWLWSNMPRTTGAIIGNRDRIRADAGSVGYRALLAFRGKRGQPPLNRQEALVRTDPKFPDSTFYGNLARLRRIDAAEAARIARWRRLHPLGSTILTAR